MARIVDSRGREADVLRRLVSFREMTVLDVGCGEGRTARQIARSASLVVGMDPDAERIESARAAAGERGSCPVEYRCEDVASSEARAASFDAVIFTRSL